MELLPFPIPFLRKHFSQSPSPSWSLASEDCRFHLRGLVILLMKITFGDKFWTEQVLCSRREVVVSSVSFGFAKSRMV